MRLVRAAFKQPVVAVAALNVMVAIIAFAKDIWLAAYVGTSLYADAFTLAYFLPDSIGNNLLAAAISVVCVPVFSGLVVKNQIGRLQEAIKRTTTRFVCISLLLMLAVFGLLNLIMDGLSAISGLALASATKPLLASLLPVIVLFVLVALGTAVLQSLHLFFVPAAAPLLFNLIFLAGVAACSITGIDVKSGVFVIVFAIALGMGLIAVWIVYAWRKAANALQRETVIARSDTAWSDWKADWKEIMHMFFSYLTVLIGMQAVYLVERVMLSAIDTGAAAALNYAFRVSQFPVWVFVAAVGVVILPTLSKSIGLNRLDDARQVMMHAFRIVVLIVLPLMLFIFTLHEPLTSALFQRGAFDERSVALTSDLLQGYALTILSQSLSLICVRYFLAIRKMSFVMATYGICGFVTILLDFLLVRWTGPSGIGYGAAIGALLNAILLLGYYWRHTQPHAQRFAFHWRSYVRAVPAMLLLPVFNQIWERMPERGPHMAVLFIAVAGTVFLAVYAAGLKTRWASIAQTIAAMMGEDRWK